MLKNHNHNELLILVAGVKGAIGSTLAAAVSALRHQPENVLPFLTTSEKFTWLFSHQNVRLSGWDITGHSLITAIEQHGVLPESVWKSYTDDINQIKVLPAPGTGLDMTTCIQSIIHDIRSLRSGFPDAMPVFVNLLPACATGPDTFETLSQIYAIQDVSLFPDMAYVLAAIFSGIPVVNFTPNCLECPAVVEEAIKNNVPLAGCDGKTGQTYFKVALASALKARNLQVDGWYSLNILGNADGKNLMDPERSAGKLANKTHLLDEILGYSVGQKYGAPSHKVHIDYYPPRGDAKEAWDVIDINGLFNMPMSLRINLQGRDSILAAPLVLDLARWMAALSVSGRKGLIPELGFYFKKPMGDHPPLTLQDQIASLQLLEKSCIEHYEQSQERA